LQFEPTLADVHELETLAGTAGIGRDLDLGAVRREPAVDFQHFRKGMLWDELVEAASDINGLPLLPGLGVEVVKRGQGAIGRAAVLRFHAFGGGELRREAVNGIRDDATVAGAD